MTKEELIQKLDNQINSLNPKYAKDIIFGINIAKDIINKTDLSCQKEINEYIQDNIWEIIRNNIDTAKEIVLN